MESLNWSIPIYLACLRAFVTPLKSLSPRRQAHSVGSTGTDCGSKRLGDKKPCLLNIDCAWVSFLADYRHYIGNDWMGDLRQYKTYTPAPLDKWLRFGHPISQQRRFKKKKEQLMLVWDIAAG